MSCGIVTEEYIWEKYDAIGILMPPKYIKILFREPYAFFNVSKKELLSTRTMLVIPKILIKVFDKEYLVYFKNPDKALNALVKDFCVTNIDDYIYLRRILIESRNILGKHSS